MTALPFTIDKALVSGRFADVFFARDGSSPVVVKVARHEPRDIEEATNAVFAANAWGFFTGSVGQTSVDANEVLAAEAATLKKATHPALVKLLREGESADKRRYLVLERIAGRTFRELLIAEQPPAARHVAELATILMEAQPALPFHGDIKPDNLLLDSHGAVRLIDPSSGWLELDKHGYRRRMLASRLYNPLLATNDVASLGLLFAEVLTGRQLFALALPQRPKRELGPALENALRGLSALGQDSAYGRVPWMPLPSELNSAVSKAQESVILRTLGLQRVGDKLDVAPAFAEVGELAAELHRVSK